MTTRKAIRWIIGCSIFINALIVVLVMASCGGRNDGGAGQAPVVQPTTKPLPSEDKEWVAIKPTVDKDCVKCHDGVKQKPALNTRDAFIHSNALLKLKGGQMPPNGVIDPAEKGRMIAYLAAHPQ